MYVECKGKMAFINYISRVYHHRLKFGINLSDTFAALCLLLAFAILRGCRFYQSCVVVRGFKCRGAYALLSPHLSDRLGNYRI